MDARGQYEQPCSHCATAIWRGAGLQSGGYSWPHSLNVILAARESRVKRTSNLSGINVHESLRRPRRRCEMRVKSLFLPRSLRTQHLRSRQQCALHVATPRCSPFLVSTVGSSAQFQPSSRPTGKPRSCAPLNADNGPPGTVLALPL